MGKFQRICALPLIAALFASPSAFATGYWNLPSNFCQCAGYGCGAGYHAPLVLGPISCRGWFATNEIRLPVPPRPPYIGYQCPHCTQGTSGFGTPTLLEPEILPTPKAFAEPQPIPAAFRTPFRY